MAGRRPECPGWAADFGLGFREIVCFRFKGVEVIQPNPLTKKGLWR